MPQSSNDLIAGLPRWDKVSQYDRELIQWLAANARSNEMVLPAMAPQFKLQPIINHLVLREMETLFLMTYMKDAHKSSELFGAQRLVAALHSQLGVDRDSQIPAENEKRRQVARTP